MRLWLRDSERRLDPVPVKTDDRRPILLGIIAWLVGLGILLAFFEPLLHNCGLWLLWTCVAGLGLGLIGLVYTQRRHG